ncbi:MAG: hypothetical protein E6L02_00400 [Thaumarchaeota archaeon]|nr:MAG: hypothetical protein E6L02_00400 [Nitrososphaerota archaeon]
MLNFSKNKPQEEISVPLDKIKNISSKIEQKIAEKLPDKDDKFIETLSVEELKDLRQVIMAAEYLLSKYQDKKDIKVFLEDFIGIVLHAANSVNVLRDDLTDLIISAESAFHQLQSLHEEVTQDFSLDRFVQTKLDEYGIKITPVKVEQAKTEPVKVELPPTLTNLTNTTRRIYTHDYLTKTAVEI